MGFGTHQSQGKEKRKETQNVIKVVWWLVRTRAGKELSGGGFPV